MRERLQLLPLDILNENLADTLRHQQKLGIELSREYFLRVLQAYFDHDSADMEAVCGVASDILFSCNFPQETEHWKAIDFDFYTIIWGLSDGTILVRQAASGNEKAVKSVTEMKMKANKYYIKSKSQIESES